MKNTLRLAAFLLSSLFLNALFLPSISYAQEQHNQGDPSKDRNLAGLTDDKKVLFHQTMAKLHADNKGIMEEIRKLHKERHDVLAADTFDKKAFLSVSAQIESKQQELEENRTQAIASLAATLNPEERQHLARAFNHHHHYHHGHHRMGHHHYRRRHHHHHHHKKGRHGAWSHENNSHHEAWQQPSRNEDMKNGGNDQIMPTYDTKSYPPYQTR